MFAATIEDWFANQADPFICWFVELNSENPCISDISISLSSLGSFY